MYQVGNEAEDLHFYGGRYGILTEKTSPAWQFTLIDSTFEGQREAAIREHEAGLTLIHDTFRDVPKAIDIDEGYPDQLWVKDSLFENIGGPVVTISLENCPNCPTAHRVWTVRADRVCPVWSTYWAVESSCGCGASALSDGRTDHLSQTGGITPWHWLRPPGDYAALRRRAGYPSARFLA